MKKKNYIIPVIITVVLVMTAFLLFEFLEVFLAPNLPAWKYRVISAVFCSVMAAVGTILALRKQTLHLEYIARQKETEALLRASEEKFRILAESTAAAIGISDDNGRPLYTNEAFNKGIGYTLEELLLMEHPARIIIHPDSYALAMEQMAARLNGQPCLARYQIKVIHKSGEARWAEISPTIITYEGRRAVMYTAIDITDLKRALEALQASEQQFRTLIETLPNFVIVHQEGNIVFFNHEALNLTGWQESDGTFLLSHVDPEYRDIVAENAARRLRGETVEDYEIVISTKSYGKRICIVRSAIIEYNGKPAILTMLIDITEQKNTEKALRASEQQFRTLIELLPNFVIVHQEGKIVFFNKEAMKLSGYSREEIDGTSFISFVEPEYRGIVVDGVTRRLRGEAVEDYEIVISTKTYGKRICIVRAAVIEYHGKPAILTMLIDITEQKNTEQALRASEARFRTLIEALPNFVIVHQEGKIVFFNREALKMGGYKPEEMEGISLLSYVDREYHDLVVENTARRLRGEAVEDYEIITVTKTGEKRICIVRSVIIEYHGKPATLTMLIDITERKAAVEKLAYLSSHDTLTDLYNRAYFDVELDRASRGRHFPVSIIVADLDGLKQVNDTRGHDAGDQLIKDAAAVLKAAFRSDDIVARTGGDEFTILLYSMDAVEAALSVERIRLLEDDFNKTAKGQPVRLSVGLASAFSGGDLLHAVKEADAAMYADKRARKALRP